ncbi:MAG: molecular chaperone DnaJ [Patescibacteria group bacterium]
MSKDYYKILGVEKNAGEEEIKSAFRKLAHKHHPDKEGGDEAKFKEINEAYQVLGNKEKRQKYEQFGSDFEQQGGFGGGVNWEDFMRQARGGGFGNGGGFNFGGIDLNDVFGDFMGFGGGRGRQQQGGADLEMELSLTFEEAVFGAKKEVEIYKTSICDYCGGTGAQHGTKMNKCSSCGGHGRKRVRQQTFFGLIETEQVCEVCGGSGQKPEIKCSTCHGSGLVKKNTKIEINVPAGVENGTTLKIAGAGEASAYGRGNLFVNLRVKNNPKFERRGTDIYQNLKISFVEAILGTKKEIETMDGQVVLTIDEGTAPGTKLRIKNKGVPKLNGSGRGDFYVTVEVEIPKKISRKQRKLLEEFGNE